MPDRAGAGFACTLPDRRPSFLVSLYHSPSRRRLGGEVEVLSRHQEGKHAAAFGRKHSGLCPPFQPPVHEGYLAIGMHTPVPDEKVRVFSHSL